MLCKEGVEIAFRLTKPLPFPEYRFAVTVFNVVAPFTFNVPSIVTGAPTPKLTFPAIHTKFP